LQDGGRNWSLAYVPREDIEVLWPLIEPFIKRACEKVETDLTPAFVRDGAKTGRYRIWLVSKGEVVVSAFAIAELPDGTAEFSAFAADRFEEWMPSILLQFADLARKAGMRALRIDGRRGWERKMTRFGFATIKRDDRTVTMDMVL
jgi:hypothetical protein